MATYDAIPKLCNALRYLGYDPYKRIHLVIDEWHLLMMNYAFRGEAIRNLLDEAKQFQNVTYISATPIERQFWFPEMQGLQELTIKWPNAKNVQVNKVKTVKIKKELDSRLAKFQPYTVPEIKKVLGEIYEDVNLEKKPVATDLNR